MARPRPTDEDLDPDDPLVQLCMAIAQAMEREHGVKLCRIVLAEPFRPTPR